MKICNVNITERKNVYKLIYFWPKGSRSVRCANPNCKRNSWVVWTDQPDPSLRTNGRHYEARVCDIDCAEKIYLEWKETQNG